MHTVLARTSFIAVLVLTLSVCGLAFGAELNVKLTVTEPSGVARKAAPVCGGVPLPAETFKKGQVFTVFRGDDAVPAQVVPLVVDANDYVRWVLVDLQTDLAAKGKAEFTLRAVAAEPKTKPEHVLQLSQSDNGVIVDTGTIQFAVSKREPFGLFSSVSAGNRKIVTGGAVRYHEYMTDKEYEAAVPESIEVQERGPMRATIRVEGPFQGDDDTKARYIARITAWAGQSKVHVKYSLSNSNSKHYCYRIIKDSSIRLKLADTPSRTLIGANQVLEAEGGGWLHQGLRPYTAGACKAGSGDKELWSQKDREDPAVGWIAAESKGGTVQVADSFFRDDPARRLAVQDGEIILTGMTARFPGTRHEPYSFTYRPLFDCSHHSSFYVIDFDAPQEPRVLHAAGRAARDELHLLAPAAWYSETQALAAGRFGTFADEAKVRRMLKKTHGGNHPPTKPGRKVNWGRYVRGEDNHFETEEDIVESLLLMYLRSGSREYYDCARAWAYYGMDRQNWRTDGWKWKDGGVWKRNGPLGNRPVRGKDPVSGRHNYSVVGWAKSWKLPNGKVLPREVCRDMYKLSTSKQCRCHNYGAGLAGWFCITGDRDALEAATDSAEQCYQWTHLVFQGARKKGHWIGFSRDFTRGCHVVAGTCMANPTDPFLVKASRFMARAFLDRPNPEPLGLPKGRYGVSKAALEKAVKRYKGAYEQMMAAMEKEGVKIENGWVVDPKMGAKWRCVFGPAEWMHTYISAAMDCYWRLTGDEDARDFVIAYGQATSHVIYQEKHGRCTGYGSFVTDFPRKGWSWDAASWAIENPKVPRKSVRISGYMAAFHVDICGRAYYLCGEPFVGERTKAFFRNTVGDWINCWGPHRENVLTALRAAQVLANRDGDTEPPVAVTDLKVTVDGDNAAVTFTAPADAGGGTVTEYQLKCAAKPLVDYEAFYERWKKNTDATVINWFAAKNVEGEPGPAKPGEKVRFTIAGIPENAKFFALRSFDNSRNRSAVSNVAER
jgi:hypothetical protein